MTGRERTTAATGASAARCDSKVWSAQCQRDDYASMSEKYLCSSCGTIAGDHEMRHDTSPYISGDTDNMS